MTKAQLWKTYCDKNPSFTENGNVSMSAKGLKKLFDQTYEVAFKEGSSLNKPMDKGTMDVFNSIFNPKK